MNQRNLRNHLLFVLLAALGLKPVTSAARDEGVKITELPDKVRVEIGGRLFTEYHYQGALHLYYYPLLNGEGQDMTRHYPMKKDVPDEANDHPHHRSLWFSHGSVSGVDFWSEGSKAGKIVHDKFLEVKSGQDAGWIKSQNKWIAPDGKVICTDETVFRVHNRAKDRLFDFEITLKAPSDSEVVLGDTKEGTMGIRIAETMRLKGKVGKGHIVQSTGVRDGDTWGKRAEWCDYYGPVNGKIVGIAIFDHPRNHAHPTWWHVRDYGLFAANPFGVHDFENKPTEPRAGNRTILPGKSLTFRYRFYIHDGDEKQGRIAERYKEYLASISAEKSK